MPNFLTIEDVLYIHANQIDHYGGDHGVRDMGLLESAIAQPQTSFDGDYLHSYPFEMAAATMYHIVQNHPFVDGNKRTGAVAAIVFLDLNDIDIDAPKGALYDLTISVATGQADKSEIAKFYNSCAK